MIRTFIAFELPGEIKSLLGEAIAGLRLKAKGVKWVPPEGLHVTLKFLGSIDEALVPPLSRGLDEVARAYPPLKVTLSRLGAFPDARRPRVIWAGLTGDIRAMADIAARVDKVCTPFGMEPEKRPFRAHVTMGRLKVPTVVDLAQEVGESPFTIENIVLYKSELSPSGARYSVLHRSVLGQEKGE
jgi:RNA 2',3'-cyclic 3'-phosphodiesterase